MKYISKKFIVLSFLLLILISFLLILFIQNNPSINTNNNVIKTTPISKKTCKVGGCSGQLCIDSNNSGISTCEYSEKYACYKSAKCEVQNDGNCGWTQTDSLLKCIENSK